MLFVLRSHSFPPIFCVQEMIGSVMLLGAGLWSCTYIFAQVSIVVALAYFAAECSTHLWRRPLGVKQRPYPILASPSLT